MPNRSSSAAATRAPAGYRAAVTTKLMHDYRVEAPATDGSRIGLVWNEASELDLVTIGTDRGLYHLYRDAGSATGWASHKLPLEYASDLLVTTSPGRPDRLFAVGKIPGIPVSVVELIRQRDGRYTPSSFGSMLMFSDSLSVAPCGSGLVAIGKSTTATYFDRLVCGILPHEAAFVLRQGTRGVAADKVVCLPREGAAWPHLTVVSLRDGALQAHRGMRESKTVGDDGHALPAPPEGAPIRICYLDCDPIALPPLPSVTDFATVRTSQNEIMLLATDGSSDVHLIMGTFDAGNPGLVQWAPQWQRLQLTGKARPSLSRVCAVQLADGRTRVLLHEAVSGNLWITGWAGPGIAVWDHAINLGIGGRGFAASVSHRQEMAFATTDPDKGMRAWTRTAGGGWRSESVHVTEGERIGQRCTRRVSVSFSDDQNTPVGSSPVTVRADDDIVVTLNGETFVIGPTSPRTVKTKVGCVHVTASVTSSLHFPKLTFEADFLDGGRLEVRADSDVQDYFKTITGSQLLDAVDPLTGIEILRGSHRTQAEADSVARALREVAALLDASYAPRKPRPGARLRVQPAGGVRFYGAADENGASRNGSARRRPAWQLSARDGRLQFKRVRPQEVEELRAGALVLQGQDDFLGIDWGSLLESAVNGLCDFLSVLVDGGRALLRVLINGAEYLIEFAVDTIEQIFDLIASVLDVAGAQLGNAIGWLMKELGFLFDWEKIIRTRDTLRRNYIESASTLPQYITDPATWEPQARAYVEDARSRLNEWIDSIRARYFGETPFQRVIGELPELPSLFESGGVNVFGQATWLIEKATDALIELGGDVPAPDIPGWSEAMDEAQQALATVETSVLSIGSTLGNGTALSWVSNLSAFRGDTIVSLLDDVARVVNAIVDAILAVLHAALRILHLAWANIPALISWLDREIYLPFLTAFYKSLFGGRLSLFDLFSLCVAIPFSIIDSSAHAWPQILNWIDITFVVWVPIHTIVEAAALADRPAAPYLRLFSSAALLAMAGGIISRPYRGAWGTLALHMVISVATNILALFTPRFRGATAATQVIVLLTSLVWAFSGGDYLPLGAAALYTITVVLSALVGFMFHGETPPPQTIITYGALQGLLAFGVTAIWLQQHEVEGEAQAALA
ncbi:MAG TPA: hypothetical protein VEL28_14550 [Candidatus Binatia bacterium]|nr:hypothetical protein [Candidatus Binatia bacterium]